MRLGGGASGALHLLTHHVPDGLLPLKQTVRHLLEPRITFPMRRPGSAGPAHLDQELFLGAHNHEVRNTDRLSGAVGLVVSILIGVSWIVSGFASNPARLEVRSRDHPRTRRC